MKRFLAMKRVLGLAAMTALSAAALLPLPSSAHQDVRGHAYYDDHQGDDRPPPPRYERVPPRQHGFVWQPGHWVERGNRWEWANGKWMRERKGHVYVPTAWVMRDGHYHLREARWVRDRRWDREQLYADRGHRRDYDRDGRHDRHDNDVDGDGVRNAYDARPRDPYRD